MECLRCSDAGRARTVMAKGKRITLKSGQLALGSSRVEKQDVGFDPTLKPQPAQWHARDGGQPHPQLGLFPHETIRDGQKRFTRDVTRAVAKGSHLVAQAPTGIGKTAAALAPSLAHAIERGRTVMFLTSRQSQHRIAVDTLRKVRDTRGAKFTVVDLVSKRDMCLRPEANEMHPGRFPDFCAAETRAAKSGNGGCQFIRDVDHDTLSQVSNGVLHVEELMHVCKGAQLCPHLVAMTAATKAQVVVADYNHLFSDIREGSLERMELDLGDVVLVVDEAHNLPDRIRQNHSHRVTNFLLGQCESEARALKANELVADLHALRGALERLVREAVQNKTARAERGDGVVQVARVELEGLATAFDAARNTGALVGGRIMQDMLDDLSEVIAKTRKATDNRVFSEELREALDDWGRFTTGALRYVQWDDDGISLHVRLLDPSVPAARVFDRVHASLLMSGTLNPPETVRDLLGLVPERTTTRTYESPFAPENRFLAIAQGISTRYKDRGPDTWDRYARMMADLCDATKGNVALFAPSYQILRDIKISLQDMQIQKEFIEEDPAWGKSERDQVLDQLEGARGRGGALLLGVLGGSFSEGVDFKGGLLAAVAIAGLPLPPPSLESDAQIGYFDKRFPGKGRLYAYTVPAINRVLQAMGRGIRGPHDKCAILLLDDRYQMPPYRQFLPGQPMASRDPIAPAARFLQAHGL